MLNFRQLCFFCSQHKATSKKGFQLSRSQLRCRLFEINDFISNVWVIIKIQRMSSQIKIDKTDDNLEPPKKYKRSTLNQIEQSLRRNKFKMGDTIKNADLEEQKNKITNYFTARPVQIRRLDTVEVKKQQKNNKQVKIQFMEEQLKAKEKVIQQFKDKKLAEEERLNKIKFETKQFKNKVKPLIAKNMLQIAESKRAERREKRVNFGYFTEGMRSFVEGQALVSIRMLVAQKQASIKKLQEARKSAKANTQDYVRLLSSLEFTHRELNQLKKQLLLREKELASYKDRLKLAEKQNKSYFSREGWPIIYDRYQTLELLGSGGFGEVYKCYDLDNQKFVAIKRMIFPERGDSAQRQDFFRHVLRQAQIQKQLSHPNIAKFQSVIEVDKNKNILVFELEYCGGPQLSVYLRKYSCLQQKEAKIIMKQLFSAIDYLSKLKQRIIHYDLKPSNIMFHQGIVKILDFGLSKIMRGEESKMQLTSQGVGTYWYLPPQTFDEYSPQINSKVDVWSLGVIFFELLYGRKPFGHGIGQQQIYVNGVILRAFKVQFPTDNPRRYKVSQSAKDFIRKCLEYRQDQRLSPSQAYNHEYFRK